MGSYQLSAVEAAKAILTGNLTSLELVQACLDRIAALEGSIGAWAFLDPDYALEQARRADLARQTGKALGPLHGVPVGIKDIFDTADMPTEHGTILHVGRRPAQDATVVALLRQAGAVILGKTVTAELGLVAPGKTTNPHDPKRTPGGSSSGSAAAVAASMVPLAVGAQNNGSIIRPASYCGVVGYKPTFGQISRHGALKQSPSLDQVGVFARTIEEAALLAERLMVFDSRDPAMRPTARPSLVAAVAASPVTKPRLAFVKSPMWDQATDRTKQAFEALVMDLGDLCTEVQLPKSFEDAVGWHRAIIEPDLANSYASEYARGKDRLSPGLLQIIQRGQMALAVEYTRALEQVPLLNAALAKIFTDFDAVLTPATPSEAPVGLQSTGSPIFCTIWTLCGTPAISLPMLQGADAMPLGVQLVAARGDDARLLRTAIWLVNRGPVPATQA